MGRRRAQACRRSERGSRLCRRERGRRTGRHDEGAGVEHDEDEEQRGVDMQRRGVGGLEDEVDGADEVVEDAAEGDVLLGDARRASVVKARERLLGWSEGKPRVMRRAGRGTRRSRRRRRGGRRQLGSRRCTRCGALVGR